MVYIDIKKPEKLAGLQSCFVRFSAYNEEFIDVIRQLPTRNFNPETKIWEVSFDRLPYLINKFYAEPIIIS